MEYQLGSKYKKRKAAQQSTDVLQDWNKLRTSGNLGSFPLQCRFWKTLGNLGTGWDKDNG